jgi:uncharacterized protein
MTRRWISDASPLILLGKIGQASLLAELCDQLIIPDKVLREVGAKPEGRMTLDVLARHGSFRTEAERPIPPEIAAWDLGPGESQVLATAQSHPGARAVVDDLEARRCAQSIGVPVVGTLGVILRARRYGMITEARPIMTALRAVGLYVSDDLLEQLLALVGE